MTCRKSGQITVRSGDADGMGVLGWVREYECAVQLFETVALSRWIGEQAGERNV